MPGPPNRRERTGPELERRLTRLQRAAAELQRIARHPTDTKTKTHPGLAEALHTFERDVVATRGELRRIYDRRAEVAATVRHPFAHHH